MLVILKEDVPNLGFKDEIVTVKDGYGRNFLIPRGIAVIASESAQKVLAEDLRQRAHKLAKIKEDATKLAQRIEGTTLTLKTRTSSTGTIYGSINSVQIADELEKLGFTELNRKMIQVPGNIKEVGEYVAHVRLLKDVTVDVPFTVESENVEKLEKKVEKVEEPKAEEATEEEAKVEEPVAEEEAKADEPAAEKEK